MANPLPPGTIPAISQLRRGGKPVGNYGCLVRGKRVNLGTSSYAKARGRAKEALAGKTEFPRDDDPVSPVSPETPSGAAPKVDWTTVLNNAAAAVATGPDAPSAEPPKTEFPKDEVKPDAYIPPVKEGAAPPETPKTGKVRLPPELGAGLVKKAAMIAVILQIEAQSWIAKKWANYKMGDVPDKGEAALGKEIGAELWEQAFAELIPTDFDIHPAIAAPLMVAVLTVPVQIAGGERLPPKTKPQGPPAQ